MSTSAVNPWLVLLNITHLAITKSSGSPRSHRGENTTKTWEHKNPDVRRHLEGLRPGGLVDRVCRLPKLQRRVTG
ncbi:hypothetical protein B0T09DRAFT_334724, partial [Sordaria sp. MPI-SDFR-AT-0083]